MSIPVETLPFFRSYWADRFVDSCVFYRVTGSTFNESTGQTVPTLTTVYSGECLARPAQGKTADYGEARNQEVDYDLYLPFDAATLEEADFGVVSSLSDPNVPNLRVLRTFQDSYLTRRRYECAAIETEESSSSSSSASSSSSS